MEINTLKLIFGICKLGDTAGGDLDTEIRNTWEENRIKLRTLVLGLINSILSTKIFPKQLMQGVTVPLFKKEESRDLNNYRAVRTLQRGHFDVKVAKAVQHKLFDSKEDRVSGDESHASALFTILVSALRTSFVTEDAGFTALFTLLHSDAPFQDTSDMLGVRVVADLYDAISDFSAALEAARTRSTLDEEDWAAHDLLTIQQWVRECYAAHVTAGTVADTVFASAARFHGKHFMEKDEDAAGEPDTALADLRTMDLDLKRQLAAFTASDESAASPAASRGVRRSRAAR
ncbi:hypothetical protein CYMTET_32753 [Cymbomonas tetramitiformis]|uniref:Uncharacterized protein n=1 Tax=Cymbomonas tetramitiformis TaxID=36881 RepID=A0AAE0FEE9_9CHLO|nr:hypothetical protein CYMTET_32753 [Cymbomonas tetramitiformis]